MRAAGGFEQRGFRIQGRGFRNHGLGCVVEDLAESKRNGRILGRIADLRLTSGGEYASNRQPNLEGTLPGPIWTRKIRDRRSLKAMMQKHRTILLAALSFALISVPAHRLKSQEPSSQSVNPSAASAPAQAQPSNTQPSSQDPDYDPRKRQRSDKDQFAAQRALKQELKGAYKTWLNQDVVWIITDEETKAFKSLSNDEERDAFIEQFWLRRNPNPDSPENEFREEHYRRIAYANEHFAAGKPGWKTDRGHIYISFGKPDSIDSHPSGGAYNRPINEGGGTTATFPFEVWHYRFLEGIGENIDLEFVDTCQCGDYHYTMDRGEKDALKMVPNAGLTQWEEMGMAKKADRFKGGNFESLGKGPNSSGEESKEFDRIEMAAKLFAPPPIKFSDLDAFISEHKLLSGPVFPFDVRTDFV